MKSASQFKMRQIYNAVAAGGTALVYCDGRARPFSVCQVLESLDHSVVLLLTGGSDCITLAPDDIVIVLAPEATRKPFASKQ